MPSLPSGYEGKLRELRELKLVFESKSEYWDDQGQFLVIALDRPISKLNRQDDTLLLEFSHPHSTWQRLRNPC
jgi:hypothetical protein